MYKIREKYTDWVGNEREEDFMFNITTSELTKMQFSKNGGFDEYLKRIIDAQDQKTIMDVFEEILRISYGVVSQDGRKFEKSDEIFKDFQSTIAYSQIYMRLVTDQKAAADFVNNVFPKDLIEQAKKDPNAPQIVKNDNVVAIPEKK